jgi:hypothetical protein
MWIFGPWASKVDPPAQSTEYSRAPFADAQISNDFEQGQTTGRTCAVSQPWVEVSRTASAHPEDGRANLNPYGPRAMKFDGLGPCAGHT